MKIYPYCYYMYSPKTSILPNMAVFRIVLNIDGNKRGKNETGYLFFLHKVDFFVSERYNVVIKCICR